MSGISRSVILAALVFFCSEVPAMAQGVGSIAGTVTDSSGGVVPRATVTLTNPQGSLGGDQTTVTNEHGSYQFLLLVPGTYVLKADMQGFRQAELRDVIVNADRTSRADLTIQLAGTESNVTVTADTQMLDTTSVQEITTLSTSELEKLPNRSDVWSEMKIVPGVIMTAGVGGASSMDVGGSGAFIQSYPTARGSTENKYAIDGMDVSATTSVAAILYLDPTSFQESSFQVGQASAENDAAGITMNVVTRTGTNQLHGSVGSQGSTLGSHLASAQNLSPQMIAGLLASVPPSVLKLNPSLQPNSNIQQFTDFNALIDGPVIKNKLWYVGTWHDDRYNVHQLGAYELNGTEMLNDNTMWNTTAKLSYQISKSSQLSYFNNLQYKLNGHSSNTLGDDLARAYKSKYPDVNQVKFISVLGTRFVLDAGYSRWRTRDIQGKEPAVQPGAIADVDLATQTYTNALSSYTDDGQDRDVVKLSGIFTLKSHDLHFGGDFDRGPSPGRKWATSTMTAEFLNGVPNAVVTSIIAVSNSKAFNAPDVPDQTYKVSTDTAFYVQDKYAMTRRLVLNLGVRFERNTSSMNASCLPKTAGFPGTCYPALTSAPKPYAFLPRLGVIYDLKGNGKTALKFGFNRYNSPILFTFLNDMLATGGFGTTVISNTRTWTDLNGDGIPQLNELGPDPGYNVPALAGNPFIGHISWPHTWEYTGGVESQLPGQLVASATYVRRLTRDNIGSENSSIPTLAYTPVTVTEYVTGQVVQVWLRDPAYAKAPITNVVFNTPQLNTEYSAVDVEVKKHMSHHFMVLGGATFQRTTLHSSGGDLNNPTNRLFDAGVPAWSIPWSYRLSGVYQAPHGVMVSGTFQFERGEGELTTVLVDSRTIKFNPGQAATQIVNVAKSAVIRPNVVQLDLSAEKSWKLTERQTLSGRINAYNALNNATLTNEVTQLGPTYHRPTAIQAGRMLKFGFNYEF